MPSSNVPWEPMLTRLPTLMPGQYGVPGTDHDTGLRLDSNGIILYVDPNHVDNNDNRDGTNPTAPLTSVAKALTLCRAYCNDTIIVAPSCYWQHDDATVGRATPIAEEVVVTTPGVRIVGLHPASSLGVPWVPVNSDGVCITVHAMNVLIEGFCFWSNIFGGTPVAIKSVWDGDTMYGDNLTVRHNYIGYGLDYGIQLDFSYYVDIHHNYFEGLGTAAIHNLDVEGDPDYAHIHHNYFLNNTAAIDLEDTDDCFIHDNQIWGDGTGTNNFIDLTGGAANTVAHNVMSCTLVAEYNTTCSDATSGSWIQNYLENGVTTGAPT